MPFEDLLVAKPQCRTCAFISSLESGLAEEVRIAVAKPIYGARSLSAAMARIDTELNPAPSRSSIESHREKGHAQ